MVWGSFASAGPGRLVKIDGPMNSALLLENPEGECLPPKVCILT